jgi:hypothetical protein
MRTLIGAVDTVAPVRYVGGRASSATPREMPDL